VFAEGSTLAAIEFVCLPADDLEDALTGYDVLEGVASLVEKSLLRQEESDGEDGEPRFVLLETLHEYAREALAARGETARSQARHAAWVLALLKEAQSHMMEPEQGSWLARLEAEHDNLRAALAWAMDEEAAVALRLGVALGPYWRVRGHLSEGRQWLERLLARGVGTPTGGGEGAELAGLGAQARTIAGNLTFDQGDYALATALYQESLALARELGDSRGVATSLNNLGMVATSQGDYEGATAFLDESLALHRQLGSQEGIARALHNLGRVATGRSDYPRATALYEESLDVRRGRGDTWGIAQGLTSLGGVAYSQGDLGQATAYFEESLVLWREVGDRRGIAASLNNLGNVAYAQDDYARARALYEESLALCRGLGDKQSIAYCLERLARVRVANSQESALEDLARAARLLSAADALRAAIRAPLLGMERGANERTVAALRAAVGEGAWATAWAEGQVLPLEEAISLALIPTATSGPSDGAAWA
jgi:tetratricopeptide (TPR) repeat protein